MNEYLRGQASEIWPFLVCSQYWICKRLVYAVVESYHLYGQATLLICANSICTSKPKKWSFVCVTSVLFVHKQLARFECSNNNLSVLICMYTKDLMQDLLKSTGVFSLTLLALSQAQIKVRLRYL